MPDSLTVEFDQSFDAEGLEAELLEVEGVEDAWAVQPRGVDLESVKLIVEMAVVSAPVVSTIIKAVRRRGKTGAKIVLQGGTAIPIADIEDEDLPALLETARAQGTAEG